MMTAVCPEPERVGGSTVAPQSHAGGSGLGGGESQRKAGQPATRQAHRWTLHISGGRRWTAVRHPFTWVRSLYPQAVMAHGLAFARLLDGACV